MNHAYDGKEPPDAEKVRVGDDSTISDRAREAIADESARVEPRTGLRPRHVLDGEAAPATADDPLSSVHAESARTRSEGGARPDAAPALKDVFRPGGPLPKLAMQASIAFIERCMGPRRCDNEGVSECVRCNSVCLARWLKTSIEHLETIAARELDNHHNALACPYCNPNGRVGDVAALARQVEVEIAKHLEWIKLESYVVDLSKLDDGRSGLATIVDHNTAMHALLYVRQVLRKAWPVTPEASR